MKENYHKEDNHKAARECRHVPKPVCSCHLSELLAEADVGAQQRRTGIYAVVPVAGTKELFVGGDWGQLKAKAELGSTGSTLMIFKVSAFKQPWKLSYSVCNSLCNIPRSSGTGSEILI